MACTRAMLITLMLVSLLTTPSWSWDSYVKDACSVTKYQDLCVDSLSSFSKTAKTNPSKWARAGVSVTIGEAKNTTRYLVDLKNKNSMKGRNRAAVFDCVDVFQDALDNLHKSLAVLRKLSAETFDTEMEDITTWISSALTNEDTCLDGFEGFKVLEGQNVEEFKVLEGKVKKASYITSNALALVTKLASAGP